MQTAGNKEPTDADASDHASASGASASTPLWMIAAEWCIQRHTETIKQSSPPDSGNEQQRGPQSGMLPVSGFSSTTVVATVATSS
ncbi:MAG: hypothetical protein OXI96_01935 [Acidimicrobiaceae bacterium]|nr:hypothetical protein [Acidimicrobiaceae bacterium]